MTPSLRAFAQQPHSCGCPPCGTSSLLQYMQDLQELEKQHCPPKAPCQCNCQCNPGMLPPPPPPPPPVITMPPPPPPIGSYDPGPELPTLGPAPEPPPAPGPPPP